MYLYYLYVQLILDFIYTTLFFVGGDFCDSMPPSLEKNGAAFACGFMRIASVVLMTIFFIVSCYCVATVWSYCEDLKVGGGGAGLPDLARYAEEQPLRKKMQQQYDSLFPNSAANITANEHSAVGPAFGGSNRIFKGVYHETDYPPPRN